MSTSQTQQIAKGKYRPEIDGLRAFAVVTVIINHFNKNILPGGYLGVDIFFVISGYVITSSLLGRSSKDFKDFISGFYERRIKRLVPALLVFVGTIGIAICLFNPFPELSLKTGIASLFGVSNLYLLKQSTDYFSQATTFNVFTHTWSLGVEEQFYILFPFLIWFSGFGRQTKNGARNLFLIVGALTIASLAGFIYLHPVNQPAAYFLMPSRFWEMAAGCLIFIGFHKRASIEQFLEKVPPLLVMALIVGAIYLPMSMASTSTIAVVALSSILIASLKKHTVAFKFFTNPKVVYVGLISYSLYLWHWGVLSISRWTIGIHWWSVPFQVALMLGLAVASYRWIETPFREGNLFGRRWKTLTIGGAALLSLSAGLLMLGSPFNGSFYQGTYRKLYLGEYKSKKSVANAYPNSTYHIMGDSHALDIYDILSINETYKTKNYIRIGCRFYFNESKKCRENLSSIQELSKEVKAGDFVILASHYLPFFLEDPIDIKRMIKYLETAIPLLEKKGATVILKLPHPEVNRPIVKHASMCKKEFFRPILDPDCFTKSVPKRQYISKRQYSMNAAMTLLNEKYPNLLVWDISNIICPDDFCSAITDGRQFLRDSNHIYIYSPAITSKIIESLNNLTNTRRNQPFSAL